MKRFLSMLLSLLLIAALVCGALAEAELVSGDVELAVPEEETALPGFAEEGDAYADFVGEAAVSAAEANEGEAPADKGLAINKKHFPDEAFRNYVLSELDWEEENVGYLSEDEIRECTDLWLYADEGITSLKGIEYLTNLDSLYCEGTRITALDLSKNARLAALELSDCPLESLTLSGNANLIDVKLQNNKLTTLKLGELKNLRHLDCSGNPLKTLDISKCPALSSLYCYDTGLTRLDASHNANLTELRCHRSLLTYVDISNCPRLIAAAKRNPKPFEENCIQFYINRTTGIWCDPATALIADGEELYGTMPQSIAGAEITVKDQLYTGKARTPKPVVKLNGVTLKRNRDYVVGYSNNVRIGLAWVTVYGIGGYTGAVKNYFRIKPKALTGVKLQAARQALTISWKPQTEVTGYEVEYSLKSDFTDAASKTVRKAQTDSLTVEGLEARKTYHVRVRAYKKIGKYYFRSAWSKAMSRKTK